MNAIARIFIGSTPHRIVSRPHSRAGNEEITAPIDELEKGLPMAFTPSKDHKRREREQRKLDKRLAREAAKSEKKLEEEEAARIAEAAAIEKARWDALTEEEQEFEKELEAERLANEEK